MVNIKKLDFSEFHPLDHSLLECRDYPGGRRRHLEYSWDFKWRGQVYARTVCRLGLHEWREWYDNSGSDEAVACRCYDCEKPKPGWTPAMTTGVGSTRSNPWRRQSLLRRIRQQLARPGR